MRSNKNLSGTIKVARNLPECKETQKICSISPGSDSVAVPYELHELLYCKKIGLRELGLMMCLLSFPAPRKFSTALVFSYSVKDRKSDVLAALERLRKLGYIHQTKSSETGDLNHWVFDFQMTQEEFAIFLKTEGTSRSDEIVASPNLIE
jgi:hypothetical protein